MKYLRYVSLTLLLWCVGFPSVADYVDTDMNDESKEEVVALFGILLTPSTFAPASSTNLEFSIYGRTVTDEGQVPDYNGDFRGAIDQVPIFASLRMNGLGITAGFAQGSEFEFSQPFIAALDYKSDLLKEQTQIGASIDVQYAMIVVTDEKRVEISASGFGVFSVTGTVSANLLQVLEPYAGISFHYIYLNAGEDRIRVARVIPKVGLQVTVLSPFILGSEIKLIRNQNLQSAWMWDMGVSLRF